MNITELRREYHKQVYDDIILTQKGQSGKEYPNFTHVGSANSNLLTLDIFRWIIRVQNKEYLGERQIDSPSFDIITKEFIKKSFTLLQHFKPGQWQYFTGSTDLLTLNDDEHLANIAKLLKKERELNPGLGGNYMMGPDIVVGRSPVTDEEINQLGILTDDPGAHAKLTSMRSANSKIERPLLHAVISCKWTLRSDRAQNARTEALNLIRNRKGHLPHIVAVTAEPYPARIAALALGTGDIDCVYHFALPELLDAVKDSNEETGKDLLDIMVGGRRLRDISDLPFDLAV